MLTQIGTRLTGLQTIEPGCKGREGPGGLYEPYAHVGVNSMQIKLIAIDCLIDEFKTVSLIDEFKYNYKRIRHRVIRFAYM